MWYHFSSLPISSLSFSFSPSIHSTPPPCHLFVSAHLTTYCSHANDQSHLSVGRLDDRRLDSHHRRGQLFRRIASRIRDHARLERGEFRKQRQDRLTERQTDRLADSRIRDHARLERGELRKQRERGETDRQTDRQTDRLADSRIQKSERGKANRVYIKIKRTDW